MCSIYQRANIKSKKLSNFESSLDCNLVTYYLYTPVVQCRLPHASFPWRWFLWAQIWPYEVSERQKRICKNKFNHSVPGGSSIGFLGSGISLISGSGFGIRDSNAKSGWESGLKECSEGGMLTITLRIMGFLKILGRDYEIEEPYWGPSAWEA